MTPQSPASLGEACQVLGSWAIAQDHSKGQYLGGQGCSACPWAEAEVSLPSLATSPLGGVNQPAWTLLKWCVCIPPGPPLELMRFQRLLPAVLSSTSLHWLQQEKEELGVSQQRG